MKKFIYCFYAVAVGALLGCDLQPKIVSLPDSVGEFISQRYPALLADPEAQPEIYNSAATDYGVYASPDLYGSVANQDYVMYASVDDYIVPPQNEVLYGAEPEVDSGQEIVVAKSEIDSGQETEPATDDASAEDIVATESTTDDYIVVPMYGGTKVQQLDKQFQEITVSAGDTLYSLAQRYNMTVDEIAKVNSLSVPYTLSVGQKLKVYVVEQKTPVMYGTDKTKDTKIEGKATTTKVALQEITVSAGDTLYSLSRKYSVPVNDLAVMNNLSAPFNLSVGQKIKVPDLGAKDIRVASAAQPAASNVVETKKPATQVTSSASQKTTAAAPAPKQKISSDPTKKLPKITARSSSKFSWPVKGTILSAYGAKSGGLFNDGINIGAARGTTVKAAENGVVAYAGNEVKGMGNLIIIQHSGGWMTVYAHMDSMIVRRGTKVAVGQKIGTVGTTGKVDRPQLHFEIRKGTKAYNPSSYLK